MNRWIGYLLICFFLSFPFCYKQATQGFRLGKLYRPKNTGESPVYSNEDISKIFDRPFFYLSHGMQAFVFEREDGEVVIKLFRIRSKNHQNSLAKTFAACELAFRFAKEETGLLYLHLHPTKQELPRLVLKNRLGISLKLPLDDYCFVVQKKTDPFEQTLLKALQEKKADPLIDSFLKLIYERASKGICNTDIHIKHNFGFLDGKAVEIDFGNYLYAPDKKEREYWQFAGHLRNFIKKHAPEYLFSYDRKVKKIYEENKM